MTAAGNEAETSTSSARRLDIISFILYTAETFLKVVVFFFYVFSFILVLENKCDCSPHKSALSCFCCIFCVLSWTFMSLPSPVVFVVSLYLILFSLLASCVYIQYIYIYIYSPSVSLVLCELLN